MLICCAVDGPEVVVGSTDHALYSINTTLSPGHRDAVRVMYPKRQGHTDWVTSVSFLSDGRVLSGGMDGRLCLWSSDRRSCQELVAHAGSLAALSTDPGNFLVSFNITCLPLHHSKFLRHDTLVSNSFF